LVVRAKPSLRVGRHWSATQSHYRRCGPVTDRPPQQRRGTVMPGVGTGRGPPKTDVVGRWSRGRPGICAVGRRVCWGVPLRWGRGASRGPCAPRGVSGAGCAWRWLVVRFGPGEGGPVWRDVLALNGPTPARSQHRVRGGPVSRDHAAPNRPTPRWSLRPQGPGQFERQRDVENAPAHAATGSGRLMVNYSPLDAPDLARGARWQRERVRSRR
jgi:hypothetical protein